MTEPIESTQPLHPSIDWDLPRYQPLVFRRPSLSLLGAIPLILILVHVQPSHACADATTLVGTTKNCESDELEKTIFRHKIKECTFHETTRIALVPQGQTACLFINSEDYKQPLGTLKLTIEKIKLLCQPKMNITLGSMK